MSNKYPRAFCGKKCLDSSLREYVTITCANCQKEVEVPKSVISRGKGRFCSWYCYTHFRGETSIEKIVRGRLVRAKIQFHQEAKVGKYHIDFLIDEFKLAIECDGDYWHGLPQTILKDKKKDLFLEEIGYKIIRFSEKDINATSGYCVTRYLKKLQANKSIRYSQC